MKKVDILNSPGQRDSRDKSQKKVARVMLRASDIHAPDSILRAGQSEILDLDGFGREILILNVEGVSMQNVALILDRW
jgi:hypothetical protein